MRSLYSLAVALVALFALVTPGAARELGGVPPAIVFERDGDLFAIAVDGSRTVRLTRTSFGEFAPAVSFDGRSIAYVRRRATQFVWTMRLDGSSARRLTSGSQPTWSPDGGTIYFTRGFDAPFGATCSSLFRIRPDGSGLRRLTRSGNSDSHYDPDVSPNGRRVAFTHANQCEGGTTSYAIRVVDTAGRPSNEVARLPGNAYYPVNPEHEAPTWSPDDRSLAFLADLQLVVWTRGGGKPRYLVKGRFSASDPEWSPDGRWIAFVKYDGPSDLYVIRPDGTGLKRLTKSRTGVSSPSWVPQLP